MKFGPRNECFSLVFALRVPYSAKSFVLYSGLEPELHRRLRAAWDAFNNIKNTTDALSCPRIRAKLFFLPALTYGSEVWTFTKTLYESPPQHNPRRIRKSVSGNLPIGAKKPTDGGG
uniref:Uncharacterized protein n=1 Tax=Caenorhabditis japonica TaxID=281687 RepID=A0A8R1E9Q4_CAEJA